MASEENLNSEPPEAQLKQLKETKKQFQAEQKAQKKEAKKRAKELEAQQLEISEQIDGNGIPVVLVTLFIIIIWLGILALLIKLDVGGVGSNILTPIFKDTPVINKILPNDDTAETNNKEAYGGYSSLKEAVDQITALELQLEKAQESNALYSDQIETLKAEVTRLSTFEDSQARFQQIKEKFYEEVVYAENGPGAEAYKIYYEQMDPITAETLYKMVVQTEVVNQKVKDYVKTFSTMEPDKAAAILESMTDDLELSADILKNMDATSRGAIMANMTPSIAARIAKLLNPSS